MEVAQLFAKMRERFYTSAAERAALSIAFFDQI
jgi:hypothetical protein